MTAPDGPTPAPLDRPRYSRVARDAAHSGDEGRMQRTLAALADLLDPQPAIPDDPAEIQRRIDVARERTEGRER